MANKNPIKKLYRKMGTHETLWRLFLENIYSMVTSTAGPIVYYSVLWALLYIIQYRGPYCILFSIVGPIVYYSVLRALLYIVQYCGPYVYYSVL